jgi:hypothetical protein
MKRTHVVLLPVLVLAGITLVNSSSAQSGYTVVDRGANYRVLQKTTYQGGTNRVHRYTELASGMNYVNNGQWTESKAQVTILPQGGAAAVQGQHQVYFPADIYNGVLKVITPDGRVLQSRPLGVSYDDSRNTVLFATLKHSSGWLTASNQVTYRDAFNGIKADLVCTYRRDGFECDLVFRQQPPTPDTYGLDAANSTLQLITEFFNTQDPQQIPAASDDWFGLQDDTLKFGSLTMTQGKAFAVGGQRTEGGGQTSVYKSWVHLQGRTFLIEEVPLVYLADDLQALPDATNALSSSSQLPSVSFKTASSHRQMPPAPEIAADTNQILVASVDLNKQPGVVLDYDEINSDQTDFTFQSGTTYYVSDDVNLSGTTVIEGGAVIKYNTHNVCSVNILGTIECLTTPDHPAILTSSDDTSVGEPFSADPGAPPSCTGALNLFVQDDLVGQDINVYVHDENNNYISGGWVFAGNYGYFTWTAGYGQHYIVGFENGYETDFWPTMGDVEVEVDESGIYASDAGTIPLCDLPVIGGTALNLENGGAINDLRIRYVGVGISSEGNYSVTNVQFSGCGTALQTVAASLYAGNILMSGVGTGFSGQDFTATAENLTFDTGYYVAWDPDVNSTVSLVNSLITGVSNYGNVPVYTNAVATLMSSTGIYQTAANASYYLTPGSPYRDIGTTDINPDLLAELQTMTTYAPQDGGSPDTSAPDYGYHYSVNEDSDFDGLPDWWEWKWFGNYNHTGSELDNGGVNTLLYDYTNNVDLSAAVQFWIEARSSYANTSQLSVPLNVTAGVPFYRAVLVDSTDFADANWTAYTPSSVAVDLGTTEGWHRVWIGLRGVGANATPTWESQEFKLDMTPPVVALANPAAITSSGVTVVKPYLQLQGLGDEQLGLISYDITNMAGVFSNQQGFVTGQVFDTNIFDFTTNEFQCCDVRLTNGMNLIKLHVSDLAGNIATTNIAVTLDYSGSTSPVVTLIWPQDGMAVSGTSITMRGTTSDETGTVVAQVVNGDGTTTTVKGLVERNGMFWLENVPLNGTSQITIQATDASGNHVTTKNMTLLPSDVVLTIDSTPAGDDLHQPSGHVSGTVSDGDYDVWVNGVEVSDGYWFDGTTWNWSVDNVPIYGRGTATFDAVAYPPEQNSSNKQQAQAMAQSMNSGSSSSSTANASYVVEMSDCVELVEYHESKDYNTPGEYEVSWDRSYNVIYSGNRRAYMGTDNIHQWIAGTPPDADYTSDEFDSWSDADTVGTAHITDSEGSDDTYPIEDFGTPYAGNKAVPDYDLLRMYGDNTYMWVTHYYARKVTFGYGEGAGKSIAKLGASTRWVLHTGGKALSGRANLFCISIGDWTPQYKRPPDGPWGWTPAYNMDPTGVGVLGQHFGIDRKFWTVLPDNQDVDLGIIVPADHAAVEPGAEKYYCWFTAYCTEPNPGCGIWLVYSNGQFGHAWWGLGSDAPLEAFDALGFNDGSLSLLNYQVGFFPKDPDPNPPFDTVPGAIHVGAARNGPETLHRTRLIGFYELLDGLNFTKGQLDNPDQYNAWNNNCTTETFKAGAAAGVALPNDRYPQNFGIDLEAMYPDE